MDEDFEVFAFDEFKKFETDGVEEVIPRHGFVYYVKNGGEVFLGDDLSIIEVIL